MLDLFNISNRRYLGNKYKLIPFIKDIVLNNCCNVESFFDVFSGTGSVASAFLDKHLYVNDMMYSNYLAALTWFSPMSINRGLLSELLSYYNNYDARNEVNYMSENFSDTYFSTDICKKIGFIRDDVEEKFNNGRINERERACIVTSLIYAMDRIAHTCGHYDSFIRDGHYDGNLILRMPNNDYDVNKKNSCFNEDANFLVDKVKCDIAYLDPPYNSRQYCDAYHLLENIARWDKPKVYGIAKKMDRTPYKSKYCWSEANLELEDLVNKLDCRYILLSYNNNGKKLQIRSNAKISDIEIMRILSKRGDVVKFEYDYRGFDAGKSDKNKDNKERVFLCYVNK